MGWKTSKSPIYPKICTKHTLKISFETPKNFIQYFDSNSIYLPLSIPLLENRKTGLKLKNCYKICKNSDISLIYRALY